ncbi:MAG TPA: helix-turn-helix transcriptional regulator [Streptosporangiaceae bacterium]|nr:helix-turn-helix transcriptional regulator [Streptosporangiaceae bacterium]
MALDPNSSALAFFGSELRRLREHAELTQAALAERTQYALPTVSAYETGKRIPSQDFAEGADKIFETDGYLVRLQGLVDALSVLPWFRNRVEVERNAAEIREYESYQTPGLLQTEDYARAVISAGRPMLAPDAIERAVALRMTRQQILEPDEDLPIDQEHTPRLWAILDEAALNRIVGSAEIMREQRQHLIELAHLPNITIQVIPNSDGVTCAYGKAFTILTSSGNGSPVVYLEDIRNARYVRDRDEVAQYVLTFDHLRACALNDSRSLDLIRGDNK